MVEETGIPVENNRLTPSQWQLSYMSQLGFKPGKLQCRVWPIGVLYLIALFLLARVDMIVVANKILPTNEYTLRQIQKKRLFEGEKH